MLNKNKKVTTFGAASEEQDYLNPKFEEITVEAHRVLLRMAQIVEIRTIVVECFQMPNYVAKHLFYLLNGTLRFQR
jgi:hypothetical protein